MPSPITIATLFTGALPRYVTLPLADELTLIAEAQSGDKTAKLTLLQQYAQGLRSLAAQEFTRAGGLVDADETRANILLAFFEALVACDGTTRVSAKLKSSAYAVADDFHLIGALTVPARTRQRYFEAHRATAITGDAKAAAAALGQCAATFDAVAAALSTTPLEQLNDSPGVLSDFDRIDVAATLSVAYSAVDADTLAIVEDAHGYAWYSGDDGGARFRSTSAGYHPLDDGTIARHRALSRSAVQRRRVAGLSAMRDALAA